jgi:hypothetical protein
MATKQEETKEALVIERKKRQEAEEAIILMLWKFRHHLPAPAVRIDAKDRQGLRDALQFNEQEPRVLIEYRGVGTPKECTIIQMVDVNGDQVICTENNEDDLDAAQRAANLRQLKQSAPIIAGQLQRDSANGIYSDDVIAQACQVLLELSKP